MSQIVIRILPTLLVFSKGLFNLFPACKVDGDSLLPNEIDKWNFQQMQNLENSEASQNFILEKLKNQFIVWAIFQLGSSIFNQKFITTIVLTSFYFCMGFLSYFGCSGFNVTIYSYRKSTVTISTGYYYVLGLSSQFILM